MCTCNIWLFKIDCFWRWFCTYANNLSFSFSTLFLGIKDLILSPLHITVVLYEIPTKCTWEVHDDNFESDHLPIFENLIEVGILECFTKTVSASYNNQTIRLGPDCRNQQNKTHTFTKIVVLTKFKNASQTVSYFTCLASGWLLQYAKNSNELIFFQTPYSHTRGSVKPPYLLSWLRPNVFY